MSDRVAQQLAERGAVVLRERLRESLLEAGAEDPELDALVQRAVQRADEVQWRRVLALCAAQELEIGVGEALWHPAVRSALELSLAPPFKPAEPVELELSAQHLHGVQTLERGEPVELRFAAQELLIIRPGGELVGRIGWSEIRELEASRVRNGIRRRPVLILRTADGEALFATPGLSVQELQGRLSPLLEQRRGDSDRSG